MKTEDTEALKRQKVKPSKIKARYSRPTCKNCSGNIWDIRGPGGPAALRPLTAASTIVQLGQSCHCPTSTRWQQTNERIISIISISKQKDSAIA